MQYPPTPYRIDRASFDNAAKTYDDEFEENSATRRLRRIIWKTMSKYFRSGDYVLELNCGTGTDALELASCGVRVLATDESPEMLHETMRKIQSTPLRSHIETRQLSFHRLQTLSGLRFDGALSNFGGLNCSRHLSEISFDLSLLLKPGSYFVLCLISSFSAWETVSFLARGEFKKAFRRQQKDGVLADVHGEKVWVHYYSPRYVQRCFADYFDVVETYGLNIFSPSPSSTHAYTLLGSFSRYLEKLDDILSSKRPFSSIGDHYVLVLKRKG